MSKILLKQIRELDRLIDELKAVARDYPDDRALALTVSQHLDHREVLNRELKTILTGNSVHLFDLAIQTAESVSISVVARLLGTMDNVIKGVGRSIGVKSLPELQMGIVFDGSLGIRTMTKYDKHLHRGDFTDCFSAFFSLNRAILSDQDVSDIFKDDRITLRKFVNYYNDIIKSNYAVQMSWTSPTMKGKVDEFLLNVDDASKAKTRLMLADTAELEEIPVTGVMKELNLMTNSFIILGEDTEKNPIQTKVSFEDGVVDMTAKMNTNINALVQFERKYNFDAEKLEETRTLIRFL